MIVIQRRTRKLNVLITLNYLDVLNKGLQVMDSTAISMCMDNDIDLVVFNMNEPGNIMNAVTQKVSGTVVTKKK